MATELNKPLSSIAIGSAEGFNQAERAINTACKTGRYDVHFFRRFYTFIQVIDKILYMYIFFYKVCSILTNEIFSQANYATYSHVLSNILYSIWILNNRKIFYKIYHSRK